MTIKKHQPGLRFPEKKPECTCTARCGDCPGVQLGMLPGCGLHRAERAESRMFSAAPDTLDALRAAVAFVELHTGNGVRHQPPAWALDFDAEKLSKHCREVITRATGSPA